MKKWSLGQQKIIWNKTAKAIEHANFMIGIEKCEIDKQSVAIVIIVASLSTNLEFSFYLEASMWSGTNLN